MSFDRNLQGAEKNDVLLVDFIKVFNATLHELANSGKIDYAYKDIAFGTFNNVSQDPFIESSSQLTSAPTKEQSISPTNGPMSLPTKSPMPQWLQVLTEPPTTMPTSTSTPTMASTAGPMSCPMNSLMSELPLGPAVSPMELPTTGSTTTTVQGACRIIAETRWTDTHCFPSAISSWRNGALVSPREPVVDLCEESLHESSI